MPVRHAAVCGRRASCRGDVRQCRQFGFGLSYETGLSLSPPSALVRLQFTKVPSGSSGCARAEFSNELVPMLLRSSDGLMARSKHSDPIS